MWIGTDNGISMLKQDGRSFLNYKHNAAYASSLSSNLIYAIFKEPNGKIWIGTEQGLNILNPSTGKFTRVDINHRNQYSIVGKAVKSILIDPQGIYWVATVRGGINKYDKHLPFFNLRQSDKLSADGSNASVITSFVQDGKDDVYAGADGGGLYLFNMGSGISKHIPIDNAGESRGLSILAMEKLGSQIWIGTYLDGVFVFDTKSRNVTQLKATQSGNSISGNDIFCIRKDSHNNIWIGTNGQGVDCFNPSSKTFLHFDKNQTGRQRLPINGYIRTIEEDKEGNIWIGSSGSGIAVYNPISGITKVLNKGNSKLPNDNVSSICVSNNGAVWVGTAGEGFALFDPNSNKFVAYSERNGLANGVIYKIIEDNAGILWISTNKGISSFDPRTQKIKNYSYYNGLQRNPFVLGAGLKLTDGRIFFGGTDGFNYFSPEKMQSGKSVPKVVLTDLKISNKSVIPFEGAEITEHISIAREIHLDYKQNFSLSFAALDYTSPH